MAKIFFKTLGCRLNQAEAERMAQNFILAGHEVIQDEDAADIRVVNTCTVTHEAAKKSRRAARGARTGQNVVVTGCHSEVAPHDFNQADLIVGNADKENLVSLALERLGTDGLALGMEYTPKGCLSLYPLVLDHTRAFVKIQDGCNLRCAFCMTTIARGASHSRSVDEILAEINTLAERGCREVVLTGVHAGAYNDGATDLGGLLQRVLTETEISRVRLSSLEPWNFKYHWMRLWQEHPARLCRHLHMSLQSGSDPVLRRMRRSYTTAAYAEKIDALRETIPDIAVTTDLIVGFPGETETEHRASVAFVERTGFAGAHVFTFSPRPGTDAAVMPNQISKEHKQHRYAEMKAITVRSAAAYRLSMKNKTSSVLWEQRESNGRWSGLSDTYVRVYADAELIQANTISGVKVVGVEDDAVVGVPGV